MRFCGSTTCACMLLALSLMGADEKDAAKKPLNEKATADAWAALAQKNFEEAIKHADVCIEEFRGAANRLQAKLEKEKAKTPSGEVNEQQKKAIFANGLLNDVATCLFIKGKALEALRRNDEAKKAYEATQKYTHARTWDANGEFFWSPAEGASDRLDVLR
jgi:hypothetical protein